MKRQKKSDEIFVKKTVESPAKSKNITIQENLDSLKVLQIFLIIFLIFLIYFPSFKGEILTWDDDRYIETNPYLKLNSENVKTLFETKTFYMGNYHPLAMLSLSIDYEIAGDNGNGGFNPFIFRFVNVLLHAFVSLSIFYFVYLLFKNFTLSFISALLFAVHTFHVESVAWISERKDVLYALFFVISLIFYLKYIDTKKYLHFALSLLMFILSLLSKGQAVSLSVTLFAIDFLRQRKLSDLKVWAEKIPFLALSLYFGLLAVKAQQTSEAIADTDIYSFGQRIIIAAYAFSVYIVKLILPVNLSAINPYYDIINKTIPAYYTLGIIPAALAVFFFIRYLKSKPEISFSIAFFVVNIALLLQFIPVGSAIYADRYSYIPSIGFFIIIGILYNKLSKNSLQLKKMLFFAGILYVGLLSVLTFNRVKVWDNSLSLWEDTVEKSPKAVVAWNNLGSWHERKASDLAEENNIILSEQHRLKAVKYFTEAVKGKPDYSSAFYNRGVSKFEYGKIKHDSAYMQSAVADFGKAIYFDDKFADSYHYRANAKSELGMFEQAGLDFDIAISLKPDQALFYVNRGINSGKAGMLVKAVEDFDKAESLDKTNHAIYSNRGFAKALLNKLDEAVKDYNKAVELKPDFYTAYYNRAIAYQKQGNYQKSIEDLSFVIKNSNNFTDAYNVRAFCYEQTGQKDKACEDYKVSAEKGNAFAAQKLKTYCVTN